MSLHPRDLPVFPWDELEPYKKRALAFGGADALVDLSVGTPVDPTPEIARQALADAADSYGYPQTYGTVDLREAIAGHYARRRGVPNLDPAGVMPTLGSKEMVALLPALLGIGEGDIVVHPTRAYPTYDVGARLAGTTPLPCDDVRELDPITAAKVKLVWINSPANPDGRVLGVAAMAGIVGWAREHGAIVASDECYAELAWEEPWVPDGVPSVLDPRVIGGDVSGVLALYSLSKQSNVAGYRAAWVAGDPAIVTRLLEVRKHAGFIMPGPVQRVMVALLGDDRHVAEQRERYRRRRAQLREALEQAGYVIEGSEAGLYLWTATADRQDGWKTVGDLADLGILVAPGIFYGEAGRAHVRISLTGSDKNISEASARLLGM